MKYQAELSLGEDARGRKLSCVISYVDDAKLVNITSVRGDRTEEYAWSFDTVKQAEEHYFGLVQRTHYLRNFVLWRTSTFRGKIQ